MNGNPMMGGNPLLNMLPGNVGSMVNALQNHPLFGLINVLRNGGDPSQLFNQISNSNPQVQQVMNVVNGRSQSEIVNMAKDSARQQGIDIAQFARQLGAPESVVKMFSE